MATRNTAIVPRYGLANDHARRIVARERWTPASSLASLGGRGRTHPHGTRLRTRGRSPVGAKPPVPSRPWCRRSLLAAIAVGGRPAACGASSGVVHGAGRSARRRRRPPSRRPETADATGDQPRPTATDTADSTEHDRVRRRHRRSSGGSSTRGWRPPSSKCRSTTTIPTGRTFELFLARRLADDQENKIGSLLINPGGPGLGGAEYAAGAEFLLGEELLERFDIVGWDPRGTGYSEPAIDCIDDYDEYYAGYDITPDDDAERQQIIDIKQEFTERCVGEQRGHPRARRHQRHRPRHGLDPPGARRGHDQLLRVQLRQRARRDVGDAVPRHRPGCRARRGVRPERRRRCEGGLQQVAGFEGTLTTYLAAVQRRPGVRVPQRRRRRGRLRRR